MKKDLINQIYTSDLDNSSYNKNADAIPEEDDEGCTEYKWMDKSALRARQSMSLVFANPTRKAGKQP